MARPHKQTVDYFPHDASASDGTTLTIIESKFGNDGFAFWFKLLERLCSTDGHFIDCRNPAKWQFLLAKTHLSEDIASSLLDTLCELQAIDKELWSNKVIWSQNLVNNIADVYKNRRSPPPQKPSLDGSKPTATIVSTDDNPPDIQNGVITTVDSPPPQLASVPLHYTPPQSKVKYSKVKDIIKADVKITSPIGEKVKEVFARIDKLRGYRPPKRKAEATSIIRMLKTYTPNQIIEAWEKLKADKFWVDKELFMMTVESQIGAILKNGTHRGSNQANSQGKTTSNKFTSGKYGHLVQK